MGGFKKWGLARYPEPNGCGRVAQHKAHEVYPTREDMASDSVTGVWFSLYWGLCGHHVHAPDPPLGGLRGGHGGQK